MTLSKATKAGRSKEAKARKHLTVDQFFFYRNAGYSYDSKTETPEQGRLRCAKELADAETIGQRLGYVLEWDFDECPDLSWMSDEEREHDHEVLRCRIPDPENTRHSLASLYGITDPTPAIAASLKQNWQQRQSRTSIVRLRLWTHTSFRVIASDWRQQLSRSKRAPPRSSVLHADTEETISRL